ncbi:putative F-box protein At1g49610 [Quercus lobata]|uniref:putative F-box protein At1g49610 n=1 Tax=Quercus lobata TaxID=97700 RepID=UPI0012463648|nr:putative F-box protein At1g49610 [Quercus lobata]
MEEEQISGSINNNFSDRSNYNSSHDTNPNNYYYDDEEESSSSSHNHQSKRSKHAPILEEEDRISAFSDSILLSILSFLPINDAIKTGVLSKRWASLWTSLPSLSFDSGSFESFEDFTKAVDDTLLLHTAHKLTNFDIQFEDDYDTVLNPRLDLWVRFATNAKVEKLSLHLWRPDRFDLDRYQLPQHLYANKFVSEFNFSCCKILPKALPHWSSLKRLCIWNSALCEDVIRKVLMGSPRLESLELHQFWGFTRLDIVSESLRKLVIDSYVQHMFESEERKLELELVAPKIECLEILGCFYMNRCRIKDVSALVEAKLDFDMRMEEEEEDDGLEEFQDILRDILESVHHVKKLTVGSSCLMALSIMTVKHLPSPSSKCKCLTIASMGEWDFPKILSLLQSSPYMETLVLDITSWGYMWPARVRQHSDVDYVVKKLKEIYFYFKSLLLHLKSVKILCSAKTFHKKEFILVVKFLLENAKVLKKMVITKPWAMQNPTRNMLRESLRVAQKLLSFPRASPNAVVMFPYQ